MNANVPSGEWFSVSILWLKISCEALGYRHIIYQPIDHDLYNPLLSVHIKHSLR